jgi:uncharacterized protein YdaU (DUF1376 family)
VNYYRRYVGDYQKKTPRLTMLEHGAYNLLLDHYYAEELPIPLDMSEVYTMVRAMTPSDRKAVDKVLAKYFTKKEDGYHNSRANAEIALAVKARDNGAKGGRPRTEAVTGNETEDETEPETKHLTGKGTGEGGKTGHPLALSLKPLTTNHQPPPKDRGAAARGSRLSLTALPDNWKAFCEHKRKDLVPAETFDRFRDYWIAIPGKDGEKLDWFATWRNWVRKEKPGARNGVPDYSEVIAKIKD